MHLAFEDDLPLEAREVHIVADEIIELIGVMAMGNLIIRHRRRQFFRLMNRDIDIGIGVRVPIDKNMTLDRQRLSWRSGRFSSCLPPSTPGRALTIYFPDS